MIDLQGKLIGRYQILESVGEGGMASVYKAFDSHLERNVAIKFIRLEAFPREMAEPLRKRFEREVKTLARLSHPHIVRISDFGEEAGTPYLVMDYLPGGTLKQFTGQAMPYTEAARLLAPIAQALDYAHRQKIIHRDVKPVNILFSAAQQPMLTDFGIAKILDSEQTALTATGTGIGTPEYMSPEQGKGENMDGRSDIYSLGIIFYELVTGHKPYQGDTPLAIMLKHVMEPLPPPQQFVPDLPTDAEWSILKALEKSPANRFANMAQFGQTLEKLSRGQPLEIEKPTLVFTPRPTPDLTGALTVPEFPVNTPPPPAQETRANLPPVKKTPPPATPARKKRGPRLLEVIFFVLMITCLGLTWWAQKNGRLNLNFNPAELSVPFIPSLQPFIGSTPEQSTKDDMRLLFIAGGDFLMGTVTEVDNAPANEKPLHKVNLKAFWIDQTEVTNAMYAGCVKDGACTPPQQNASGTHSQYYDNPEFDDYPVIYVDWSQAEAYCRWAGRRLPSEAEWEKAARGEDGRAYPWGNTPPGKNLLNYGGRFGDTTRVGSFPDGASPYGALDMAGNVWEWTADWFDPDYYAYTPLADPTGPETGTYRVVRGDSWGNPSNSTISSGRTTTRAGRHPSEAGVNYGFRCAKDG